jgi:hypothetical protein
MYFSRKTNISIFPLERLRAQLSSPAVNRHGI